MISPENQIVQDIHKQIERFTLLRFRTTNTDVDYKDAALVICLSMVSDMLSDVTTLLKNYRWNSDRFSGITQWKVHSVTIFVLDISKNIFIEATDAVTEVDCTYLYTMHPTNLLLFVAIYNQLSV